MTVHEKLMKARITLQGTKLSKSGKNKFAGYNYFELGDFLPIVQEIFLGLGISGVVSYGADEAILRITDFDDKSDFIEIKSPMSTAALKGAHEIQNLGAVQTYLRRYLWVTAMEIVEHDALDAVLGSDDGQPAQQRRTAPQKPPAAPAKAPEPIPHAELVKRLDGLGITPFGMKTLMAICNVEKVEDINAATTKKLLSVGSDHVAMFNQGKNSTGKQILPAPVKDQVSEKSSIDELAKAAEEMFSDD